jgi:hypothetical protein
MIGELLDIGEDGMRLRATQPPTIGSTVVVHLALPSCNHVEGRSCSLEGQVVWAKGHTVGLSFTERTSEAFNTIRALLKKELAKRSRR